MICLVFLRLVGGSMVVVDRRSALAMGAAAAASLGFAGSAQAQPAAYNDPEPLTENPVLFWNAVSLELVALDHSIDPDDAAAPGPCASARALGVVHAVIADAVCLAYRAGYRPQFYRGPKPRIEVPALFVGGAAAGILLHIFSSPIHAFTIGARRQDYQRIVGNNSGEDWQAGLAFARYPKFIEMWDWADMRRKILPQLARYIPRPRQHNLDPFNTSQGFYGVGWGEQEPLVLQPRQIPELAAGAPPPEGSPEYERDLAEVAVLGALHSRGNKYFPARTPAQTSIGLFWAYDGARLIGTPPRLFNQILRKIAIRDGLRIDEMARLFALCNLAMADAGIVCWWAKYKYNVWRPVLGIQFHAHSPIPGWRPLGSPKTNPARFQLGPDSVVRETAQKLVGGGESLLIKQLRYSRDYSSFRRILEAEDDFYAEAAFTPNFPSYPSGHATFGGAFFHALRLFRATRRNTADDPDRIDGSFVSDELNGISIDNFRDEPRPYHRIVYTSIEDMIRDNDISRVYLGVHWRFDSNRGSDSGKRIAEAVFEAVYNARA